MIDLSCDFRIKALRIFLLVFMMPCLSIQERNQALGMVRCGRNSTRVAKVFSWHKFTISRKQDGLRQTRSLKEHPRSRQKRKTSATDDRNITILMLRKRSTTAKRLKQDLFCELHVRVSRSTVNRSLRASVVKSHRLYRGAALTKQNDEQR